MVGMTGSVRAFDQKTPSAIQEIRRIAERIPESAGDKAKVEMLELFDPMQNDDRLKIGMAPVLARPVAGPVHNHK
jgi:hypothetical protein